MTQKVSSNLVGPLRLRAIKTVLSHMRVLQDELENEFPFTSASFRGFRTQLSQCQSIIAQAQQQEPQNLDQEMNDVAHHISTIDALQMQAEAVIEWSDAGRRTWLENTQEKVRVCCEAIIELTTRMDASGSQVPPSVNFEYVTVVVPPTVPLHQTDVSPPVVVVAWDPDLVDPNDYTNLMKTLGDLVRYHGGQGIRLLRSETYGLQRVDGGNL